MAWLRHIVTVLPVEEPITLPDVKEHCRVIDSFDDVALNAYIRAARGSVEERCGVKLVTQTCKLLGSQFCDLQSLPIYPLISVASIKYLDVNGIEQTVAPGDYTVVAGRNPSVYLNSGKSWPATYCAKDTIRLTGDFGFGTSAKVPDSIKLAMYLMVSGWSENRESLGSKLIDLLPNGVEALLADYLPPVG